jgi:hypothetical protein
MLNQIYDQRNLPKYMQLRVELHKWQELFDIYPPDNENLLSNEEIRDWIKRGSKSKQALRKIIGTLGHLRHEEWRNAKTHYIQIGKYGNIARMTNPKNRSGAYCR